MKEGRKERKKVGGDSKTLNLLYKLRNSEGLELHRSQNVVQIQLILNLLPLLHTQNRSRPIVLPSAISRSLSLSLATNVP